jgi:hypothetical protein
MNSTTAQATNQAPTIGKSFRDLTREDFEILRQMMADPRREELGSAAHAAIDALQHLSEAAKRQPGNRFTELMLVVDRCMGILRHRLDAAGMTQPALSLRNV